MKTRHVFLLKLTGVCAILVTALLVRGYAPSAQGLAIAAPALDAAASSQEQTAVFAGGCFWGVQGVFQHVRGVKNAVSGYAGGDGSKAHYEEVGSGRTGHAEAVQVTFDPRQVSFGKLLQVFFSVAHNPTELNRQGPDSGTQYRSAVFPQSPEQRKLTLAYIAQLNAARSFGGPIVTTIEDGKAFYPAEGYHQNYLNLHPTDGYIVVNDLPKVAALQRVLPQLYRKEPALVP